MTKKKLTRARIGMLEPQVATLDTRIAKPSSGQGTRRRPPKDDSPSVYDVLAAEEEQILKDPAHPKYREFFNAKLAREDDDD